VAIVAAAAFLSACGPGPQSNEQVKSAIEAAGRTFSDDVARGDAAGLAAAYAADAMILPPGAGAVTGADAIRAFWQKEIDTGVRGLKLEIISVDTAGDLAVETGTYTITDANGGHVDHGKYVVTWTREAGAWKVSRDIWSTSMPPPGAPPAADAPASSPPGGGDSAPAPFSS
jgi:uncharacterized protein (TIGR02246 family)